MDSTPETFEEVRDRTPEFLRELLAGRTPRLRVWAAWALGLRFGAEAVPLLEERLSNEPHPGVRRHFVRVLAGFGATDLLRELEASDPDPRVRRDARRFWHRCSSDSNSSTDLGP